MQLSQVVNSFKKLNSLQDNLNYIQVKEDSGFNIVSHNHCFGWLTKLFHKIWKPHSERFHTVSLSVYGFYVTKIKNYVHLLDLNQLRELEKTLTIIDCRWKSETKNSIPNRLSEELGLITGIINSKISFFDEHSQVEVLRDTSPRSAWHN